MTSLVCVFRTSQAGTQTDIPKMISSFITSWSLCSGHMFVTEPRSVQSRAMILTFYCDSVQRVHSVIEDLSAGDGH